MAAQKDRIVVGDTYRIAFQAVQKSSDQRVLTKTAVIPDSAKITMWDVIASEAVPIGPNYELEVAATISDNKIEYLIPADRFEADKDYKVFVTATFTTLQGTEKITNVQAVRVLARQ